MLSSSQPLCASMDPQVQCRFLSFFGQMHAQISRSGIQIIMSSITIVTLQDLMIKHKSDDQMRIIDQVDLKQLFFTSSCLSHDIMGVVICRCTREYCAPAIFPLNQHGFIHFDNKKNVGNFCGLIGSGMIHKQYGTTRANKFGKRTETLDYLRAAEYMVCQTFWNYTVAAGTTAVAGKVTSEVPHVSALHFYTSNRFN